MLSLLRAELPVDKKNGSKIWKMSHTDIIIVVGILTFFSTVGLIGCIRSIRVTTPTPTNLLSRRNHDIELQEIQSNARDIDLSSLPQYPQAMINHEPIRWTTYYPPRYSEITQYYPPGYNEITENINCPLELEIFFPISDAMELFLILAIFMGIIFIYFRFSYRSKSKF